MASLDQMGQAPAPQGAAPAQGQRGKQASGLEELDLEIAVKMGTRLMKEAGGLKAIEQALGGSGDPVQAISKFLVQLIMQIKEAVSSQGVELSPNIVLAQGGWVEQMLDVIEGELGLPADFSDQVFGDVVETFKALAQSPQGGGGAAPQQAQASQGIAGAMQAQPAGVPPRG